MNKGSFFSVVIMCACLLLLTGMNFVIYPAIDHSTFSDSMEKKDAPQAPVEEKSSENKNITNAQEEYLHDHTNNELAAFNHLSLHKLHKAEKLQLIYFDILVPPPKA